MAKIKASGADSVITGNWGNDMSLLVKAGKDAGLNVDWYTYYAGGLGTPTAMGEAAAGKVKIIAEYHSNVENNKAAKWDADYRKQAPKGNPDFYFLRGKIMWDMFAKAIVQAKSVEPKAVALALEGMRHDGELGEVEMRKSRPPADPAALRADAGEVRGEGRAEEREDRHGRQRPRADHQRAARGLHVGDADLLPDEAAVAAGSEADGEPPSSPFLFLPWNSSSSRP